jgi:hypothetical protein
VVQTLAVTDYINSLAKAEAQFGLSYIDDPLFFPEWSSDLPDLSIAEQQRLDLTKQRYLYLLEMAGFYDPPFHLRSEASIRLEIQDDEDKIYQGRIDSLIVQENFWIVLVESKRTSFSVDVALPQAIAYMAANPEPKQPTFGLVSNGAYSIFIKLHQSQYSFSEDFSLNRRHNELYNVLKVLNRLKTR